MNELNRIPLIAAVLFAFCCCAISLSRATDWPGWRGPTGSGNTDDAALPLNWDGKTGKNVLWKTPTPASTGHSSPIVWGDFVFVTTAAKQSQKDEAAKIIPEHYLNCLSITDGKILWKTPIAPGKEPAGYAIYAVPTPVTDGKMVYAWFGSGVMAAVDFSGKLVWRVERNGPFKLNPGICSSPVLYNDTVIQLVDQSNSLGYLLALDKATGEVKWEQKRPKVSNNNTTPLLLNAPDKPQLVVAGSNILQGLNPSNGDPIWWCKSNASGASPIFGSGLIYNEKGVGEPAMAIDPSGTGDVAATKVKWQIPKSAGEYASSVIVGDYIYRTCKPSEIVCRKLSTGEQVYTQHVAGLSMSSSPIATADRVYFISPDKSLVIKAGPIFELHATNSLNGNGGNGASPAVSRGRIFIRDDGAVYCVGNK